MQKRRCGLMNPVTALKAQSVKRLSLQLNQAFAVTTLAVHFQNGLSGLAHNLDGEPLPTAGTIQNFIF
jgi:hypothetical protein